MNLRMKLWMGGAALAAVAVLALAVPAAAQGPGGFFNRGGDRAQGLADQLGISVDELASAQERAFEAGVAQAVEDGDLEAEQAELMIAGRKLGNAIDREAVMAEAFGIDAADLSAAREEGTMRELFEGIDLDRATLRDRMQAAQEAAVDTAVNDGVITREQADALQDGAGRRGFGHGMRGFGGKHGMCPGMRGGEAQQGGFDQGSVRPPVERSTDA